MTRKSSVFCLSLYLTEQELLGTPSDEGLSGESQTPEAAVSYIWRSALLPPTLLH